MSPRKKILLTVFILGLILVSLGVFLLAQPHLYFCKVNGDSIDKDSLYCLINKVRHKKRLQLFKPNPQLEKAAELRAFDIVAHNQFSHESISGMTQREAVTEAGYQYTNVGEILARQFNTNEEVFNSWINSASHSAIILRPHFQDMGITVFDSGRLPKEKVVVGLFGLEENK